MIKEPIFSTSESANFWRDKVNDWANWADPVGKKAYGLNKPILDFLDIQSTDYILDLASGVGEPAISEAKLINEKGLCIASDIVPEMLFNLQKRKETDKLYFTAADMQRLPFKDQTFNKISCRFGLMFVPDLHMATQELYRICTKNGKAALIFWGPKEDQRLFRILEESIKIALQRDVGQNIDNKYRLQAKDAVAPLFQKAGFEIIENKLIEYFPTAPIGPKFWTPQLEMSFGHVLKDLTSHEKGKLDREILNQLTPYKQEDGYQLKLTTRLLALQKN